LAVSSFRRAANSLDRAIAIDPTKGNYYAFRALAHMGLGESDPANADIKSAVDLGFDAELLSEQVDDMQSR
jgi:Tfp pilus assembly protein PilF